MRAGIGLHYLDLAHYQGAGGEFSPSSLFGDTDTGGFYDPSDLTSMHSHSAGTAAATELWPNVSVGDSVGMILDKSQMGGSTAESYVDTLDVLGELDNAGFDTDTDWTKGTGWTISGGTANASAATGNLLQNLNADLAADKVYYVEVEVVTATSGSFAINVGGTQQTSEISTVGVHSSIVHTGSSGNTILYFIPSTFTGSIDNVVIKEIPGNHSIAPSDAARPILRDEIVDGTDVDVSQQTELVTNGTFDTDISGWTNFQGGAGQGGSSWNAGTLEFDRNGSDYDAPYQVLTLEANKWYKLSLDITNLPVNIRVGIGILNTAMLQEDGTTAGSYEFLFLATQTSVWLTFQSSGTGTSNVDNVSVKEVPAEASRRYYLEFDGTDDCLLNDGGLDDGWAGAKTVAAAITDVGDASGDYFYSLVESGNAPLVRCPINSAGLRIYNEAAAYEGITGVDPGTDTFVHMIGVDSASAIWGRHNGASGTVADPEDAWWSATGADRGIGLATSQSDSFNGGAECNFYGFFYIGRQLTTLERQNLEIYLANKSGVTLDSSSASSFPALLYDANTDGGLYDPSDLDEYACRARRRYRYVDKQ